MRGQHHEFARVPVGHRVIPDTALARGGIQAYGTCNDGTEITGQTKPTMGESILTLQAALDQRGKGETV